MTTDRRTFLTWLFGAPLVGAMAPRLMACNDEGTVATADSGADITGGDAGTDAIGGLDVAGDVGSDVAADTGAQDVADSVAADVAGETEVSASCEVTRPDAQGPFYEPNAPSTMDLAAAGEAGAKIAIVGTVLAADCTTPIAGATVEVWHADDAGDYHDDKLRATLTADGQGGYAFQSVKPGAYFDLGGFRPAHFHYKVSAPGYRSVTTQVYFEGDPYLSPNDSCGSCGSDDVDRIIVVSPGADGVLGGRCNVVLAPS